VRSIGRGLHPTVLSQGGLPSALPRLEAVDERVVVEVGPQLARAPRPDPDVEAAVYYAAAELVTNAVRHGDPERIVVVAELTSGVDAAEPRPGLRLLVEQTPGRSSAGEGVVMVRDRAQGLGGTVTVDDPPGRTVVEVWLPLGAPRADGG
jgi:signal transduction histidine kinase